MVHNAMLPRFVRLSRIRNTKFQLRPRHIRHSHEKASSGQSLYTPIFSDAGAKPRETPDEKRGQAIESTREALFQERLSRFNTADKPLLRPKKNLLEAARETLSRKKAARDSQSQKRPNGFETVDQSSTQQKGKLFESTREALFQKRVSRFETADQSFLRQKEHRIGEARGEAPFQKGESRFDTTKKSSAQRRESPFEATKETRESLLQKRLSRFDTADKSLLGQKEQLVSKAGGKAPLQKRENRFDTADKLLLRQKERLISGAKGQSPFQRRESRFDNAGQSLAPQKDYPPRKSKGLRNRFREGPRKTTGIMSAANERPRKRPRLQKEKNKSLKTAGARDWPTKDDILAKDVESLRTTVDLPTETDNSAVPEKFSEAEVKILSISCQGEGLGLLPGSRYVVSVPFCLVGETVRAKIVNVDSKGHFATADFVKIIESSPTRDDSNVKCQYFSKCAGCQIQMSAYADQLKFKKSVVERAYRYFSTLNPDQIPKVDDTMASPLQYDYRTKLTPHFTRPYTVSPADRKKGIKAHFDKVPPIGFQNKGAPFIIDIEDCPLGTPAVRMGMKKERKRIADTIHQYHDGSTLLVREHTLKSVTPNKDHRPAQELSTSDPDSVKITETIITPESITETVKTCATNSRELATDYIGDLHITNTAGAFFQNNNSILVPFLDYVRSVVPSVGSKQYLVDAYSGSGMFTLALSGNFIHSTGIDIDERSIKAANDNAKANGLDLSCVKFIAADAAVLFKRITYPADQTVVVIDPPRKGCSDDFISQLLEFGPAAVVYVSCNVHSQARDVGNIVQKGGYRIESLRGFDFFPQTSHVEGVAVLRKVDSEESKS